MATRNKFNFLPNGAQPTAPGALLALDVDDRVASSLTIQVAGTFVATITWQGTVDGTNWTSVAAVDTASTTGAMAVSTAAPITVRIDTTGFTQIRPNVTAFTSSTSLAVTANGVQG